MKKLLSIVITAIGIISGYKKTIAAQKAEISRLQAIIDQEEIDDKERDAKLAELQGFEADAETKASDLAALLADEPAVPTVDPGTFNVTAAPTEHVSDLAFREQQAETAGAGAVGGDATTAQTGPAAGAASGEGDQGAGKSAEEEDETAVEALVADNSKEDLLALAEKENVEVPASGTKSEIAAAIVAARREANGPQS